MGQFVAQIIAIWALLLAGFLMGWCCRPRENVHRDAMLRRAEEYRLEKAREALCYDVALRHHLGIALHRSRN